MYCLLVIQDICLSWGKRERGFVCAKKRAEFPVVYSLDKLPEIFHGKVMVHRLDFLQKETMFQKLHMNNVYPFQFYDSVHDINLTNLSIRTNLQNYEVAFFYDQNRSGRPVRQGHNKDYHNIDSPLYRHDILNETVFSLKQGQYGRIIWNERKTDYDTGEWYYQYHIINLLHYMGKMIREDIFLNSRLDFEYKQIAKLY